MISHIDLVIFLGVLAVIAFSVYQDTKNQVLNLLASEYPKPSGYRLDRKCVETSIEMVFFWLSGKQEDYDYLNSMKVCLSKEGISVLPTVNHFAMRPLFIPWDELEIVGMRKLWMRERLVLSTRRASVNIAILGKWHAKAQDNVRAT